MNGFTLKELLKEANVMENIVLPPEIKIQLTGFNIVRLRLLHSRNILAACMWAMDNPARFKANLIHILDPELKNKEIAAFIKENSDNVKRYLNNPIISESVWDRVPEADEIRMAIQ